jgi:hypothetical protein
MSIPANDQEPPKTQNVAWWIASIAISVVFCSVQFVLFASYLVELKNDLRDTTLRINAIEEREDRILTSIEQIGKRTNIQVGQTPITQQPASTAESAPAAPWPPSAPAEPPAATGAEPSSAPPSAAPTVTVPVIQAAPDKP